MKFEQLCEIYKDAVNQQMKGCDQKIDAELRKMEKSGNKSAVMLDCFEGMKGALLAALAALECYVSYQRLMEGRDNDGN